MQLSLTLSVTLFLICLQSCIVRSKLLTPKEFKLVSGVQLDHVPFSSAHFYRQYVPIVYQFSVPRWNKSEMVIRGSQNCNTFNYTKFFTTCPILGYLPEVQDRFSEYFDSNQPLVVNLQKMNALPETTQIPFDCELIRPHFDDIYIDKLTFADYLSRLQACSPLGSQEFIKGLSNYVYNISGVFEEMRYNFYWEYWLKIDLLDGRVDAALWANAVNLLNALVFQNYMMESNRWKMALMECEAGRVPSSLLSPSLLADTLNDMLTDLTAEHILPSVDIDTVGNYYKSPLTDCTFTNDTFVVRILVPVINQNDKFALMKVTPIWFHYYDDGSQTDWDCGVSHQFLPPGADDGDKYVLVNLENGVVYETECGPGELCHIPTQLHPSSKSPCMTAAYNWEKAMVGDEKAEARRELEKSCPITCTQRSSFASTPPIHAPPSNFIWFEGRFARGKEQVALQINCELPQKSTNVTRRIDTLSPVKYGAQQVDIDCYCWLVIRNSTYKPSPCGLFRNQGKKRNYGTVDVVQLAPVQWYPNVDKIDKVWSVPPEIFSQPDISLIEQAMLVHDGGSYAGETIQATGGNSFIIFLSIITLGLVTMVAGLAWRLYTLIKQLEDIGLNVRDSVSATTPTSSSYNVSPGGGGEHQVSYRSMNSGVDTDSLLINEERH